MERKLSIEISYCSSDDDAKTAEIFQAQMKKIGIDVVVNTSTADFWERVGGEGGNDFDVLIMGTYINSAGRHAAGIHVQQEYSGA